MNVAPMRFRATVSPKIQIFVSDLSATGVVRNAIAIANLAAASGLQVRLLTCRADGILRNEIDPAVEVIELLRGTRIESRRMSHKRIFLAYRRHSRDWRPDILFSAGNHGHLLSTIAWLGLPGAKILRISNDLDHQHAGLGAISSVIRSIKFRIMTRLADRIVLVSRALLDHPRLSFHIRGGKALLIPNGVDADRVAIGAAAPVSHVWLADSRTPVVLAVGRPAPQKNFDTLLPAFATAASKRDMRLIVLGGDGVETESLRHMAARLGIAPKVDFVPAVANPFGFMAAADVLALPSLWEGSSNVLLEAMACGTPVIASNTAGDARHILDNGRFGMLVDPLNEHQLAEAILWQTGDRPVLPGERALSFDRGTAHALYIKLFNQMAGNFAAHRARIGQPEAQDFRIVPPMRQLTPSGSRR